MHQQWNHVLFMNWKIDPKLIQSQVPFELDLFEGSAVVSVVPFQMSKIRFGFSPALPYFSNLWELNLRTYVKHEGKKGIYFFALDTDSIIGQWVASSLFKLPYQNASIEPNVSGNTFSFTSSRKEYFLYLQARWNQEVPVKTEFDHWVVERYHLFLMDGPQVIRGDVLHEPWDLYPAQFLEYTGDFEGLAGLQFKTPPDSIAYCPILKVRFLPFVKC